MANYPAAAANIRSFFEYCCTIRRARGARFGLHSYRMPTATIEEAAETAVARMVEEYTLVADTRTCTSVRTWKILGDWPEHDSDVSLTIQSGGQSFQLRLKVRITVKGTSFSAHLYDYSNGANGRLTEKGRIVRNANRVEFRFNPPPVRPPSSESPIWDPAIA